jgi:hypothetical protein
MAKPPPSEWGKLSAGQTYLPWAVDFARAVFSVGLRPNVGMLFWHVLEGSWGASKRTRDGWPDPAPVQVSYAELAALWGLDRQSVYRAKQWLVKARLLIENEAGLWVNKNADQWADPENGTPLLPAERLAYARAGRTRTSKPDQQSTGKRGRLQDTPPSSAQALTTNGCMSAQALTPVSADDDNGKRVRLQPPIEERARGEMGKEKSKAAAAGASPLETPEDVLPLPDPDHDLIRITPGPHRPSRVEVLEAWTALWRYFNPDDVDARERLCNAYYVAQEQLPHATWMEVFREAFRRKTFSIRSVNYLFKIARDIESGKVFKGAPTIPFPTELKAKPKPQPPAPRASAAFIEHFYGKKGQAQA